MTANIMLEDREIYKDYSMNDCVGKPFTSQELWRCLMKYLKPINWQAENAALAKQREAELRQKIINNFVKNNKRRFVEITDALSAGDIKSAHRMVHTLKANAGQLNKTLLQRAAEEIEIQLENGENNTNPQQLRTFEMELNAVLAELALMVTETAASTEEPLDEAAALALLKELEPLLKDSNPVCLEYVDRLWLIPGCEELIQQMENFEFELGAETLKVLLKR